MSAAEIRRRELIIAEMWRYFNENNFGVGICRGLLYGEEFIEHMEKWLREQGR